MYKSNQAVIPFDTWLSLKSVEKLTSLNLTMLGCLRDLWLMISLWTFSSICNKQYHNEREAIDKISWISNKHIKENGHRKLKPSSTYSLFLSLHPSPSPTSKLFLGVCRERRTKERRHFFFISNRNLLSNPRTQEVYKKRTSPEKRQKKKKIRNM